MQWLAIYLRGVLMGACDVVPGVSGGTIAFITGIYDRLIDAIRALTPANAMLLLRGDLKTLWERIDGTFLVVLLSGIATSVFTLAHVITYLMDTFPVLVWSFFCGLVLASSVVVFGSLKEKSWSTLLFGLIGLILAYLITSLTPTTTPQEWWFIFLSGAIAIIAMILPGISGSFILLLLGQYTFIMDSVKAFHVPIMLIFGAGIVVGITLFSHGLHYLLKHHHTKTIALLVGFMLGSLNKVWPWKEVLQSTVDSKGHVVPLVEANILPAMYADKVGDPQLLWAILLAVVGFVLVYTLEKKFATTP